MKNTFDKVVSTGCSFSRDLNINDIENPDEDENMGFLYPQLVADKLNAECINLSMSGADNEYIIHTIVDYAQNNDNKNKAMGRYNVTHDVIRLSYGYFF